MTFKISPRGSIHLMRIGGEFETGKLGSNVCHQTMESLGHEGESESGKQIRPFQKSQIENILSMISDDHCRTQDAIQEAQFHIHFQSSILCCNGRDSLVQWSRPNRCEGD